MSVMLLLILALVSMTPRWPETPSWLVTPSWLEESLGPVAPLLATTCCLALVWLAGSVIARNCCRAIRREPGQARQLLKHFHARQRNYFLVLNLAFLGSLYFLGWGDFISRKCWDETHHVSWPGRQLVLLAPLLAGLVCSWARFYDPERTVHDQESRIRSQGLGVRGQEVRGRPSEAPFLSRAAYIGLQVRFNLLLIVPPLVLMLLREICHWAIPGLRNNPDFDPIFITMFLFAALVGMPWLLRIFLGLRQLPPGPLRDRLEATSRRLNFRCSAIVLWNTRQSSANAMVTGILPWPRYIVLTDQLLRDLSPEEVEAVIGHEIGHVKHHHMFFYMMFLFGSLLSLGYLWQLFETFLQSDYVLELVRDWLPALEPWLEKDTLELVSVFSSLLGVALYLFIVFGYLSRYCETQADIFGSRTSSNEVFISALEKVAFLNGIPREKPGWLSSWRHPSIAARVDFLRRMDEEPDMEPRFQRRIGLFKWSLALGLAAVLVTLWIVVPKENETRGQTSEVRGQVFDL
jgi:STE24 endopeptidase